MYLTPTENQVLQFTFKFILIVNTFLSAHANSYSLCLYVDHYKPEHNLHFKIRTLKPLQF